MYWISSATNKFICLQPPYSLVIKTGKNWFSSDFHFGHDNILTYVKRPFKDVNEMNLAIIENVNSVCGTRDTLYFLGDFCFENESRGFSGEKFEEMLDPKIIIIRGNHDGRSSTNSIIQEMTIKIGGRFIFLCHEPYPKLSLNLCGHVHDLWKVIKVGHKYIVNVGVDTWQGYPITVNEILEAVNKYGQKWERWV